MADVYGADGYDIDEYGNMVPKGTTLNSNPTLTAPPGSPRRALNFDAAGRAGRHPSYYHASLFKRTTRCP